MDVKSCFQADPLKADAVAKNTPASVSSRFVTKENYETFLRGINAKSPDQLRTEVRAWHEVVLFTEAFYFFGWRLVEVLTGGGA